MRERHGEYSFIPEGANAMSQRYVRKWRQRH
jgi:hypothetical protein